MKVALERSEYSPHEDSDGMLMGRKPLGGGGGDDCEPATEAACDEPQPQEPGSGEHTAEGFRSTPPSPLVQDAYAYAGQPDHLSPVPSNGSWGGHPAYRHGLGSVSTHSLASASTSPFYQSPVYHGHPPPNNIPPPAYYDPSGWHPHPPHVTPPPPVMPSMANPGPGAYYSQGSFPPGPPALAAYGPMDGRRGSLSSFGSTEQLDMSAGSMGGPPLRIAPSSFPPRRRGHGSRRRGGRHSNSHGSHSNGGRGGGGGAGAAGQWLRHDDSATLHHLRGRIVSVAKDRDGSKFVQRRLASRPDPEELQIAYEEALGGIEELWNDVYGNYILQGLLENGTDAMRDGIGRRIVEGDVPGLSTKVYGCRFIQKALDTLDKDQVADIVSCVKGKVWHLVHDHNGNHVVQKSVTRINELFHQTRAGRPGEDDDGASAELLLSSLDVIVDEVGAGIRDLAVHPYGCRVVQRLVEHCTGSQRGRVLDRIAEGGLFDVLIEHEYGNYVVQRVLAYGRTEDREAVFESVRGNVLKLSKQKHSSNVVEMMLTYGDAAQRHCIVEEILNCFCVDQSFASKSAAVSMAEDAYANYVCKTALDVLQDGSPQRERMYAVLLANLEELEKSPFAKQVVLRVKTYAQESAYE